ncbi:hypothetical protein GJAV_G00156370 [Gymnothorax javanicus]|nr:hypothetical protein GJAV_G00156370 [Gymnothorax javanicus]
MDTSNQIVKVTKGLSTAAECREDTKLLMQPYANWEEYLTPAPMSIAILAELIFISSKDDFSIRKGGPEGGFQHIKYPDSFRACLMQVCNSGWSAFNEAHKSMDQIRLYTSSVPNYIKTAVRILLQDDDQLVQTMLPNELESISNISDECLTLATATERKFTDVIDLISELLETCTSAKQVYGSQLEDVRRKIEESKLKKQASEEANRRAERAVKNLSNELEEAQESFRTSMASIPSGWEMLGMNFVEGISNSVVTIISAVASTISNPDHNSAVKGEGVQQPDAESENDPNSANNIYAKSSQILSLVHNLGSFFEGDQIKWTEIIDQKTGVPKTQWVEGQFKQISNLIEKEANCEPKVKGLALCKTAIKVCSELAKISPEERTNGAKTKEIVGLLNCLRKKAEAFDTKSKSVTNTSAFPPKPPQMSRTQEKTPGSKSAGQMAADNARFQIEQSRAQLDKVRELYEKSVDNMEKNKKEMTEILVTLENCKVKDIDFTTAIRMLSEGLRAMGQVKEQWQKLVRFFQMVSNLMKTCLSKSLKDFTQKSATASALKYSQKMFMKDMIYYQAFYASNIASLVNMISGTYTEVSDLYLMDAVSKLSTLMSMDVTQPEFQNERIQMALSCKEAEKGIRNRVRKNKADFEMKTKQRLEKIESELKAVLPPEPEEKIVEIREAVQEAYKEHQDEDCYV